jgi:hypothetical protein
LLVGGGGALVGNGLGRIVRTEEGNGVAGSVIGANVMAMDVGAMVVSLVVPWASVAAKLTPAENTLEVNRIMLRHTQLCVNYLIEMQASSMVYVAAASSLSSIVLT